MGELRPSLDPLFRDFGVAATVTVPGGAPISATVMRSGLAPAFPTGGEMMIRQHLQHVALRRSEIPAVPTGTKIVIGATTLLVQALAGEDDEIVWAVVA